MADAMDCDLVYAFVPRKGLEAFLWQAAREKAARLLGKTAIHMSLEAQTVGESRRTQVEDLARLLMEKGDVW